MAKRKVAVKAETFRVWVPVDDRGVIIRDAAHRPLGSWTRAEAVSNNAGCEFEIVEVEVVVRAPRRKVGRAGRG
jgi:hypothetical protein